VTALSTEKQGPGAIRTWWRCRAQPSPDGAARTVLRLLWDRESTIDVRVAGPCHEGTNGRWAGV